MRRYAAIDIMSVMENLADTDREAEFMVQIPETAFISNFTMLINDELFIAEIKGTHIYRPQKKLGKVMFSEVFVCPQGEVVLCRGGATRGFAMNGCCERGCQERGCHEEGTMKGVP